MVDAFDALRRCLRWEPDYELAHLMAELLCEHQEYCSRDEAALIVLKSRWLYDPWPLDFLGQDDGVVRLRYWTTLPPPRANDKVVVDQARGGINRSD